MEKYVGRKQVKAEPMTKGEAFENNLLHKGAELCEGDADVAGYLVEYEDGYKSWSPAGVFEKSYKRAESFADRLLIEREELADKVGKLEAALQSPELGSDVFKRMQNNMFLLMVEQLRHMKEYLRVLDERLKELGL